MRISVGFLGTQVAAVVALCAFFPTAAKAQDYVSAGGGVNAAISSEEGKLGGVARIWGESDRPWRGSERAEGGNGANFSGGGIGSTHGHLLLNVGAFQIKNVDPSHGERREYKKFGWLYGNHNMVFSDAQIGAFDPLSVVGIAAGIPSGVRIRGNPDGLGKSKWTLDAVASPVQFYLDPASAKSGYGPGASLRLRANPVGESLTLEAGAQLIARALTFGQPKEGGANAALELTARYNTDRGVYIFGSAKVNQRLGKPSTEAVASGSVSLPKTVFTGMLGTGIGM